MTLFIILEKSRTTNSISAMQPGFELNIVNTPVPATGIVCQAFKDAAGTDLLGLPFGGQERYQAQISNHPYPVHIGSLICSDEEGVQAQIKRAQKSGGIIGVRSSPAGPEPVDGTQIAVEKAMPNPDPITIDTWEKRDFEVEPIESMEEMEADDEFYRGQSGAVNRPEEEKPAPSPYWNGVTSSWVYPDNPWWCGATIWS